MSQFNWVDYVIIAIFLFSTLSGLMRGFVREILSLITLIAAFIVATLFANDVALMFTSSESVQHVVGQASNPSTSQSVSFIALAISYALLFAGTIIIGAIISFFINLAFEAGVLGFGNRLLGGVFGLVRGFILNLVIIFLVQITWLSNEAWWHESRLVPEFQPAVAWLGNMVSPSLANLKEKFGQTMENVNAKFQGQKGSSSSQAK